MKDYIKGTFKKIIFKSDQNYIIGLFKVSDTNTADLEEYIGSTITFTGYFHELTIDEKYMFYGELVDNPKYGLQYKVNEYERVKPEGKDAIIDFLSSDLFPGVGEKSAKQIVNTLGDDTLNLIMEDYSNLLFVPNMKEAKAKNIHDILSKYNESYDTIIYLTSIGFSMKDSMLIYNNYKEMTKYIIEEDVYALIDDIDEINFAKIELVRKNLNISDLDGRRIMALVIYVMNDLCFKNGDTFLYFDEIYDGVIKLLDYEFSKDEFYDILIEIANTGKIKIEEDEYYLKEYFDSENNIANTIYHLTNKNDTKYKKIEKEIESLENYFDVTYNEKQILAIKNAYEKNFSIITGGPGTGKTTIIKAIVELYRRLHKYSYDELTSKLILLASTGRAAKRMSESCLLPAYTIHRFLKWNKESNKFLVNESNKSNAEFVIIDEVSMIDVNLLDNLFKGLSKNIKIVMIGDYNQLESVGPGKVLKDLIDSDMINVTFLNELYRQDENSYIATLASEIKKNDLSEDFLTKKEDYSFIEANASNLKKYIEKVCLMAIEKGYSSDDIQLLAPMYKGENGIDNLNKLLQSIFNPDRGQNSIVSKDVIYRENDKILQLENDPDNNVFNGDIGYIMDITGSTITVDFDGNIVKYTPKDFIKIKHGYAISIHKAQGSEFKLVILPIIFSYRIMLYKKIIYTAVTRARNNLTIIGDPSSFVYAVNNENVYERKTKLKDRLLSYLMNI